MLAMQDSHCCSDQLSKDGSKIKLEMEEINTEHYLTTNQIVSIKEGFRLYRKLHCWYLYILKMGLHTNL